MILDLYQRILPTLLIDPASIFQQDNALTHTAQIVREFIADLGREIMIWPPCSPGLNPIKNLWTLLKQKIYEIRPDLLHMCYGHPGSHDNQRRPKRPLYPRSADMTQEPIYIVRNLSGRAMTICLIITLPSLF